MNFLKIILFSLFFCSLSAQISMKDFIKKPPEERATIITDSLTWQLKLTKEQIPLVKKANLHSAFRTQKEVIESDPNIFSKISRLKKIDAEKTVVLTKVLNKQQLEKYLENRNKKAKLLTMLFSK